MSRHFTIARQAKPVSRIPLQKTDTLGNQTQPGRPADGRPPRFFSRKRYFSVKNHFTRLRYSSVRVSISILSPISTKAGTGSSKPVLMRAGFITLPEVSPLTAGSV